MKKTLLSLAFAGLNAASSLASPLQLNRLLTEDKTAYSQVAAENGTVVFIRKEVPTARGYALNVDASSDFYGRGSVLCKSLGFEIDDGTTRVYISDQGADGLSKGDFFILRHKLVNGDNLFFSLGYLEGNNYSVYGRMASDTNSVFSVDINTSDLNPLSRLLVKNKTKPLISLGKQLYKNLVESTIEQKQPELPYEDVKTALREFENCLSDANQDSRKLESGLLKLSKKYLDIIKQKTDSLTK
jgi:hypothetical protein